MLANPERHGCARFTSPFYLAKHAQTCYTRLKIPNSFSTGSFLKFLKWKYITLRIIQKNVYDSERVKKITVVRTSAYG